MYTSRRLLAFTIQLVFLHISTANAVTHRWSQRYGDTADQVATSIAIDLSGNVIVTGDFSGTVDFGGGPVVCSSPTTCMYLAKLDPSGDHMWSRNLGDSLAYATNLLAIDGSSSVLVGSQFRGTVDFGGGPITSQGFRDGVIAKFDAQGNHVWSKAFGSSTALVDPAATGIGGSALDAVHLRAHPNPFNPQTTIVYGLSDPGVPHLRLYDARGRHVRTLIHRWMPAGQHTVTWDGHDSDGARVASGVYFLRLEFPGRALTRRLVLLK